MIAAALAAALAAAQAGASPSVPAEFVAGRATLGRWRMEAVTVVNNDDPWPPMIGNGRCTISGRGLRLVVPRNYGGSLEIGGNGLPFATSDIVAIALGGNVYETAMRPLPFPRTRYSDIAYPPDHVDPDSAAPVETALGVRLAPADPWLNVLVLLDDLMEVRSIGISYRTRDGEARARLSVAGLGGAIGWCMRAFDSDRARTLPQPIRR